MRHAKPRFYRGVLLTLEVSHTRWWTAHVGGHFVRADTLDGVKRLVREAKP